MDVILASHFEVIQQFMRDRPWWELKVSRPHNIKWEVVLVNQNDPGPFGVEFFENMNLGEALRQLSVWIGRQNAIQEREATEVSLDETPGDSKALDKREQPLAKADQETPIRCHCGKPVHYYEEMNNFTRGLCLHCSTVRCDIDPSFCK